MEELEIQASAISPSTPASDILQRLKQARAKESYSLLITRLQEEVTQILGLAFSEWPTVQQGFFEMGMDSLMAVELKTRLAKHLGMTLPNTLIFDYPNLHKLAHYLGGKIGCLPDDKVLSKEEYNVSKIEQSIDDEEMESAIAEKLAKLEALMAGSSGE